MEVETKLIGNRIKFYRNRLGLSQKGLALKTGISQSYITELENGKSKYKQLNTLLKLSNFFKISLDDLFFDNLEKYREISFDDNQEITDILKDLSLLSVQKLKCVFNIAEDFLYLNENQ